MSAAAPLNVLGDVVAPVVTVADVLRRVVLLAISGTMPGADETTDAETLVDETTTGTVADTEVTLAEVTTTALEETTLPPTTTGTEDTTTGTITDEAIRAAAEDTTVV